jgi:hypothetical protein
MAGKGSERRRVPRIRLQIPMFVRGTDAAGETFLDLSRTVDISAGGAYLALTRSIRTNELLSLTIPAPPPASNGLVPGPTPPIQARVRRTYAAGDVNLVGVEFLKPLE